MSTLAIRLQKTFFKVPYSRKKRTKAAEEALLDARIWLCATNPDVHLEKWSCAAYLPGDVYSWVEFEFFFDFSSEDEASRLTEGGLKERLAKRIQAMLVKQLPAVEDPVVAVWLR